jgi:aromatic ring hydroxylase
MDSTLKELDTFERKIAELIKYVESFYACGIASSVFGKETPAGNFSPDPVYANIGKLLQGLHVYDLFKVAHEISGGILVTSPYPEDMEVCSVKDRLSKYLQAREDIPTDHRLDVIFFSNLPWDHIKGFLINSLFEEIYTWSTILLAEKFDESIFVNAFKVKQNLTQLS